MFRVTYCHSHDDSMANNNRSLAKQFCSHSVRSNKHSNYPFSAGTYKQRNCDRCNPCKKDKKLPNEYTMDPTNMHSTFVKSVCFNHTYQYSTFR
jgi:hypothetical protein